MNRVALLEKKVAEMERKINNMFMRVSVDKTEPGEATLRVKDESGIESGSVEYFQGRAGKNATWNPPDEGEQGILFCPSGDISSGIFLGGLPSDNSPAISANQDEARTNFGDGGYISYNRSSGAMTAKLVSSFNIEIGGVAINISSGKITINGAEILVNGGNITLPSHDVIARGHSLDNHKHPDVMKGPATTGSAIP